MPQPHEEDESTLAASMVREVTGTDAESGEDLLGSEEARAIYREAMGRKDFEGAVPGWMVLPPNSREWWRVMELLEQHAPRVAARYKGTTLLPADLKRSEDRLSSIRPTHLLRESRLVSVPNT